MTNEDLLNELDNDFGSDFESDAGGDDVPIKQTIDSEEPENLLLILERFILNYKPVIYSHELPNNAADIAPTYWQKSTLLRLMEKGQDERAALLLSKLQPIIQQEISAVHMLLRKLYEPKFPELQSIVTSGEDYARVIQHLEHESGQLNIEKLQEIVSREQMLVLSMAIQVGYDKDAAVSSQISNLLPDSIDLLLQLCSIHQGIKKFVTSLISNIAPNLCELLGHEIAATLIAFTGGLQELSEIPSCNLASIGKPAYLSHASVTDQSGVRQRGAVYHCKLVQDHPVSVRKQALKMTCAKAALCARVDYAQSSPRGELGSQWRTEIAVKLQNIQEPPSVANIKALPIPEDKPKKKRAGRRFRKYKQQFQLSNARQLQNRMEFGKQESTFRDVFGEEIGMGMVNTLGGQISAGGYTKAIPTKLRAPMKERLAAASKDTESFFFTNSDNRADLLKSSAGGHDKNSNGRGVKEDVSDSNHWYTKLMDSQGSPKG
ncbi:LADA_0C04280g1_1 [Lachancea dasiensis]|uniref:LADA_0C04280g1_1 n=1 Tax=Lachancea dasiensis TaxID=1072105 RepID=A0A1G4IYR8_9SACH|nr:LADA_0C04280g1_1 [Lachancea dasiensis]